LAETSAIRRRCGLPISHFLDGKRGQQKSEGFERFYFVMFFYLEMERKHHKRIRENKRRGRKKERWKKRE